MSETNGGEFAYWDNTRTQPAGESEQEIKQKQMEALSNYFNRAQQQADNRAIASPRIPPTVGYYPPSPTQSAISLPGQGLTLTIATNQVKLDIQITPL